ncbi:MAG: Na+-driven multidrug efflux pump [Bacillariaceae sp.]|jgi:Na+-driven multidrug efflux pump
MRISKNCLLPTWVLASVVAADAFIPVSGLHHRSKSIASNTNFLPLSTSGSCRLKSVETSGREDSSSAEEIPRGGSSVLKDKPPAQPTWKDYRKFAIPCLALWVAQPLLSLVDTSFVGLSAGAAESATQLAALGPATTFFDGATYLFAFLNVATTNLYSSAIAQKGEASDQAEAVVTTASRVALRCGIGIMLFLWAFARPLLALYIGTYRIVSYRIMSNRLVETAIIFYYYNIFAVHCLSRSSVSDTFLRGVFSF